MEFLFQVTVANALEIDDNVCRQKVYETVEKFQVENNRVF